MSFLESPKSRFTSITSAITAGTSANSTPHLKPGCVQCGSLLEITDRRKTNFSGKCFRCEHWFDEEDEDFEDLED
jgi:hypothetical protein